MRVRSLQRRLRASSAGWRRRSHSERTGEASIMSSSTGADGRLRVAIVGCGVIANSHVPYVRKAGGEPVALCDLSIAASSELADRHGIQRVYRDVQQMLDVERPDAVHVLTPPHTHARVAAMS